MARKKGNDREPEAARSESTKPGFMGFSALEGGFLVVLAFLVFLVFSMVTQVTCYVKQ